MNQIISTATADYLLGYLRDEMLAGTDRRADRAVEELERYLAEVGRPDCYTLRQEGAGWRVGAGDGLLVPAPSGEVARGLGALEIAVAFPGEQIRLGDFLEPGRDFANPHGLARKLISVTRKWIGDEIDVGMADLLAGCTVSTDDLDRPVVTCAPLPVAVVTSYTAAP